MSPPLAGDIPKRISQSKRGKGLGPGHGSIPNTEFEATRSTQGDLGERGMEREGGKGGRRHIPEGTAIV